MKGVKIALTGKMRSGKDTAGEYLVNKYGFKRFAFGDAVREICQQLYPEQIEEGKPRFLYQQVGQALRKQDRNVWVKTLLRQIENETTLDDNIVITDLRQFNEYQHVLTTGFTIGRIWANEKTRRERMKTLGDNFDYNDLYHETEQGIDALVVDYEIVNVGELQELHRQVDAWLHRI
ncbi:AAA family ATPase [Heliorestis convoluta]|uniref:AAA family ATPase n=1 Tax=Heliorestis convoluta TaxID=356322 RepID=A0A5Q2N1I9_9FIRM|nr:AAA family ATPase [Heliorestis convoluta]QGG47683.1 AAA family ATPase [Heliorestis convoluta]